mmetsp:Transcript_6093/g.9105  ORF Transcript_6093/g.9105 Transcript_6093/m.9105 type:complete len:323 (+) Transcript_6093:1734-2702(+)
MKSKKLLLDYVMKLTTEKSFSYFLIQNGKFRLHNAKENVSIFDYTVPAHLCHTHVGSNFATSSILALFDEVSSYSLMMFDKTCRGGVSIQLSAETLRNSKPKDEIAVTTKVDKIGRYLGFCSIEMHDKSSGSLLAKGKHIKFMAMGLVWDVIASPLILPFTLFWWQFFSSNSFGIKIARLFSKKKPKKEIAPFLRRDLEGLTSMSNMIDLVEVKSTDDVKSIEWTPLRDYNNMLGKLHGGAAALAIEKACMLYLAPNEQVGALEVIYLAPAKGKVHIVLNTEITKSEPTVISTQKISGKVVSTDGRGQVFSQFTATIATNMQ